jgi:hypothetical protein
MSAERLYSALQVGLSLCEVEMALMNIIAAMNGNYFHGLAKHCSEVSLRTRYHVYHTDLVPIVPINL